MKTHDEALQASKFELRPLSRVVIQLDCRVTRLGGRRYVQPQHELPLVQCSRARA